MKILHTVKLFSPRSGGMYEVVKQLSERLAAKGHEVTIATLPILEKEKRLSHNIKIAEFDIKGNHVKGFSGEVEKYHNFVCSDSFDIITNFAAQQPMTDTLLPILSKIKAKKVFVPTGFNGLYLKPSRKYFEKMPEYMNNYDINIIISKEQRDMHFALKHNIKNFIIISNGASEEEFQQKKLPSIRKKFSIPKESLLILHVGSHTGYKGHLQAIKIFARSNTKQTTLLIVGNEPVCGCIKNCIKEAKRYNNSNDFKTKSKRIIINHLSRSETISAYKEADIFLFPSNIEGGAPIVLFESLATATPFLATDVGNTKEIAQVTGGGIILPTKKNVPPENSLINFFKHLIKVILEYFDIGTFHTDRGFVRAKISPSAKILEELCNNKFKREEIGKKGYLAWKKSFTWKKISDDYEKLYLDLLKK